MRFGRVVSSLATPTRSFASWAPSMCTDTEPVAAKGRSKRARCSPLCVGWRVDLRRQIPRHLAPGRARNARAPSARADRSHEGQGPQRRPRQAAPLQRALRLPSPPVNFTGSPPRSSPVNAVRWRNSRIPALLDDHQRHRGLGGCCSLGANAKAPSFAFDALTHRTLRTETEPWYFGPSPHLRQCPNHRWVRERTAWDALPVRAHRRTPRSLDTCRR